MNKFEQLIEYVINDDEANAKALFHEIVVDKSKDIYEEIMAEEEVMEKQGYKDREDEHLGAKDGKEADKSQSMKDRRDDEMGKEGKRDKDNNNDQKIDEMEMGGSQVDDLIDDIETEEQGATFEDDEEEINDKSSSIGVMMLVSKIPTNSSNLDCGTAHSTLCPSKALRI